MIYFNKSFSLLKEDIMAKTLKITINGKTQSLTEWCRDFNQKYKTVHTRIYKYKWSIKQALEFIPPPQKSTIDRITDNLKHNPETFCWEWVRCLSKDGYGQIKIDGKMQKVHRVMYKYIYGDIPPNKPLVLHRCDNPKCCNPMHLYAGTPQNNMDDMAKRNFSTKGENNYHAKLTEKQVLEIRASKEPQVVIAKRLNVAPSNICLIKQRKTWKHI